MYSAPLTQSFVEPPFITVTDAAEIWVITSIANLDTENIDSSLIK